MIETLMALALILAPGGETAAPADHPATAVQPAPPTIPHATPLVDHTVGPAADTVPGGFPARELGDLPEEVEALHRRLASLLAGFRDMEGLRDARIELDEAGVLVLSGRALSEEDRSQAEELAAGVEGVRKVENRIEVGERAPWDEADPVADAPATGAPADDPASPTEPPADAPAGAEGAEETASGAVLRSILVILGVVLAAVIVLTRMRRIRSDL